MATARAAFLIALMALPHAHAAAPDARLAAMGLEGSGLFQVGWTVVESERSFEGRLDEGDARHLKIDVPQRNVTEFSVLLRWAESDDASGISQPDAFELNVERPTGGPVAGSPGKSRTGVLRVSSGLVNELPTPFEVEARSAAAVREAAERFASDDGTGQWTVVLRLVDSGNPQGAKVDSGNSYSLTVRVRAFEAVLTRVVSLEPPPLTVAEAARAAPAAWLWSAGGLALAASTLGVVLARDALKRRS